MEQGKQYSISLVSKEEKLARIVLSPRDLDPITGYPKDSFITLRDDEGGISFLRFDFMGENAFRESGNARATLYNKNLKKPRYAFAGWMEGIVTDAVILDIMDELYHLLKYVPL